ncbi:MAG: hypothetical protein NZM16_09780 [Thermoflexus sp.]|nr:hypothetical protein [Thermoflexus sp.]MDW8181033.1 hypothetical protein [Anaerolineae bacterium]MCS6964321.1 hypothetical protein [Thermoflexus sp.]MCS7351575.1 hypothetical protein [Thermoflexus sp.]MCX7689246.1 hypothetical protein [Thermoflexus sp.]MDW8183782.1 hypothetical protein [Anaerolineae bacterium]
MAQAEEADPEQRHDSHAFRAAFFARRDQVEEVLRGFESKAHQGTVKKSIVEAVDFPALEPEKEQEEKPFGGLFRKRRHQAAGDQIPHKPFLQQGLQGHLGKNGEDNRGQHPPEERGEKQPSGLLFVAIQPPNEQRINQMLWGRRDRPLQILNSYVENIQRHQRRSNASTSR